MRKAIILLLCILLLSGCSADSVTPTTETVPESVAIDNSFTLVIPKNAHIAVTQAAQCIRTTFDYKMDLAKLQTGVTDPGRKAIVFQVDESMDADTHKVELKGNSIYITAQNPHVLLQITRQLRQLMLDNGAGAVVTKEMCAKLTGKTAMSNLPFRFLSQNILFKDIEGGNTVAQRAPRFSALMKEYCPDILAVQEHSNGWGGYICGEFSKIYTQINIQGLAFYFRTERYDVLEKGGFYMSPTPDIKSQFEGDSGPRSCIWAIARDRFTNTTILFINCHPDWNNDTQRALQVEVIFEVLGDKMKEYPTILCGDFNTTPDGPIYPRITEVFNDPYVEAEINISKIDYTCHSFGAAENFIDYSFYDDSFKATHYYIINDMYEGHVSDHYGTFTDFVLNQ